MARGGKETVQFTATIAAGTEQTFSYQIKSEGTVERIVGKFYPGQQGALHVRPYLLLNGDRPEELIRYVSGSNAYLSGDDREFDYPIDFEVQGDDTLKVYAQNVSAYDYTLEIAVVIDYMAGRMRA